MHAQLLQSCPTFCDSMDCSPPGSSVHGTLQARILEWAAMLSSRGSFQPNDRTHISCISFTAGGFFTNEPQRKPLCIHFHHLRKNLNNTAVFTASLPPTTVFKHLLILYHGSQKKYLFNGYKLCKRNKIKNISSLAPFLSSCK